MEVSALTLAELEQLLDEYPWFTLARKEYVRRRRSFGEEELREAAARAGIYLLSRSEFLAEITGRQPKTEVREAPVSVQAETAEQRSRRENSYKVISAFEDRHVLSYFVKTSQGDYF